MKVTTVNNLIILWHFELKRSSLDIFFFYKKSLSFWNNVLLAIATDIPMLRKTGFAVQGHIYCMCEMQNTNMSITEEKQLVVGQTHTR